MNNLLFTVHVVYLLTLLIYIKRTFLELKPYDPNDKIFASLPAEVRHVGMSNDQLNISKLNIWRRPESDVRVYPPTSIIMLLLLLLCIFLLSLYDIF